MGNPSSPYGGVITSGASLDDVIHGLRVERVYRCPDSFLSSLRPCHEVSWSTLPHALHPVITHPETTEPGDPGPE